MVIEAISPSTVKITLRKSDMDRFGLKYADLSRESFETKLLLSSLISVITEQDTIKFSSDRLFIEAFDQPNEGCIIYISSIPEKTEVRLKTSDKANRTSIYTIEAKSPDILKNSAAGLADIQNEFVGKCRLYASSGAYRLVMEIPKKLEKKLFKFASDHSLEIRTDDITASVTNEHWQCLIHENAVEELNRKLTSAN